MNNVQDHIAPQIALRKGYSMSIVVKPIKYSKKRSVGLFKATLRVFKKKDSPFNTVALYTRSHKHYIILTPNTRKFYNYYQ